jgi:hypothetical protein
MHKREWNTSRTKQWKLINWSHKYRVGLIKRKCSKGTIDFLNMDDGFVEIPPHVHTRPIRFKVVKDQLKISHNKKMFYFSSSTSDYGHNSC